MSHDIRFYTTDSPQSAGRIEVPGFPAGCFESFVVTKDDVSHEEITPICFYSKFWITTLPWSDSPGISTLFDIIQVVKCASVFKGD